MIGGINGYLSGRRQIYRWSSPSGIAAFVLDSTWALITTGAGVAAYALGSIVGDPGYIDDLSRRQNRHVYRRGFRLRKGFAVTFGNSVHGVGEGSGHRHLVTDHENVHIWQGRLFGPLFPVAYAGWSVGGALVGMLAWMVGYRPASLKAMIDSFGYYLNPFEWWAYSRDGSWPPRRLVPGIGWKRPIVASFASRRNA